MPQFRIARCFLPLAIALLAWSTASAQGPRSGDARFLDGLRQRRLFELAEKYCQQKLNDEKLPPVKQGDLTIELIRTLAQHAAFARPEERDDLWKQARVTAAEFVRTQAKHPRLILVRVQDALTPLAQGELARQELEAGAAPPGGTDGAKAAVREAARLLEALSVDLNREIAGRRRTTPKGGELSADELFSLGNHLQHQLAKAQRIQGRLYEPNTADRASSLGQAKKTLAAALSQATENPALAADLRLDLAICERLLAEFDESRRLLGELDRPGTPTTVRLTARAELVRVELDQQRLPEAQKLVEQERLIDGQSSPELELAALEVFMAQLRAASSAGDKTAIEKWQKLAAQQARLLTEAHGSYWGRRADQLLVRSLPRGTVGNAELLARTADSLYLKGEFDQALSAYDQAAEKAGQSGDDKSALELGYKAALVQEGRKLHKSAAERFCALAIQFKRQPQAPAAHLRGIWNAAQEVRRDSAYEREYEKLLVELIDTWPAHESAQQARMWQGRLFETRQDWAKAGATYRGVPPESEHYATAVAAAISSLRLELAALTAAGQEPAQAARQGVDYLRGVILGPEQRLPDKWSDTQRDAALAVAGVILDFLPADASQAEEFLKSAIAGGGDAPREWISAARAQLVLALASQPAKRQSAEQMLKQMSEGSPDQLLDLLRGLSAIVGRSRPEVRSELAALQLATVELLAPHRARLDKPGQLTLDRARAEALVASQRRDEALEIYARLAKENPAQGGIQEAYGELLLAGSDKESLANALAQWRMVAARSRSRTERWFKARYSIALAQQKLGDKAGAATLLEYVLKTPPGMEGTAWKARYEALLEECQQMRD